MTVTIKDISEKLGKSIATVSRALGDYDDIGEETKEKVRQTAAELGYVPNAAASRLKKKRSDTIGLILPDSDLRFSDMFFGELLTGISKQIDKLGYNLLVSTVTADKTEINLYKQYIASRQVDGFILVRTQREDIRTQYLQEENFPFISFGHNDRDLATSYVDDDGESGICKAVNHLVELGHTRLACIAEPVSYIRSFHRLSGFYKGMQMNGLEINEDYVLDGGFHRASGRNMTNKLLDMENPPTAIVAVNDLIALGAIQAVQERGLVVGEDISITGYDDVMMAEIVHPRLTTLHVPASELGASLSQLLIDQILNKETEIKSINIEPELIIRNSTGPVKQ